ncbi:hypothetical protein [Snodgrassella alvi]|jgi:hypothetical protein|nr:hypothetical protein [Snodgrassella alvi]
MAKWQYSNVGGKVQKNKSAPPHVFVMQFQPLNGNKVTVKDIWAG